MFVLLIGLLGVGAMIPAGRSEIMQGVKTDYATTVGRAAFRDLKARGYLNPRYWVHNNAIAFTGVPPTFGFGPFATTVAPDSQQARAAVAIDPLGVTAPTSFGIVFPNNSGAVAPMARINLLQVPPPAFVPMPKEVADGIFRCSDDLVTAPGVGRDAPPTQQPIPFGATGAGILSRSSEGNYSWLATVVTDPHSSAMSSKVIVSVAVFYKRDLGPGGDKESSARVNSIVDTEYQIDLSPPVTPLFAEGLRPGQWIMLAGTVGTGPDRERHFGWYRVVGAAKVHTLGGAPTQEITLAGRDWIPIAANTNVWLFERVIAVFEKNMQLEIE
jgi:hypothetical protein